MDRSGNCGSCWVCSLAGVGIVVLGLLDDRFVVRGRHKLLGKSSVSWLLCCFGYDIQSIRLFGLQLDLGLLSVPVTVGWLVLATNSLNLIDGIDGLASTVGILLRLSELDADRPARRCNRNEPRFAIQIGGHFGCRSRNNKAIRRRLFDPTTYGGVHGNRRLGPGHARRHARRPRSALTCPARCPSFAIPPFRPRLPDLN